MFFVQSPTVHIEFGTTLQIFYSATGPNSIQTNQIETLTIVSRVNKLN